MNCPECSTPIEKNAHFCPKCYARIEPPGLWQRFLSLFQGQGQRRTSVVTIRKTLNIKTRDKDGQAREYHSLDEVPAELRAQIQQLESDAEKEALSGGSNTGKLITRKTTSVIKVKDAAGNERIYHSLDELPPELRAVVENAQKKAE
jgi:hypothetical protein